MLVPDHLLQPLPQFAESYADKVAAGRELLARSRVAFVGLARNCDEPLYHNLLRLLHIAHACGGWRMHVETNDNEDATDQVLTDFCREYRQATFTSQRLGRQQFSAEFGGPRTIALAEYRTACQRWVRENAADSDYVVVIDFDAWGGWVQVGVLHGFGWLDATPGAYGMASVSLLETPQMSVSADGQPAVYRGWAHYDAWAIRGVGQVGVWYDDYTVGQGGWKHGWLPPVGSAPVRVCSAFGGMTIYHAAAYLAGTYDGETDCEHVAFHRSAARATLRSLYLCPGMRTLMRWMEPNDGRQHGND